MTSPATIARDNAVHFEAKKTGFGQAQDGWSITLRVQHDDLPAHIKDSRKGTRYMVALVEIADDETPINRKEGDASAGFSSVPKQPDTPPRLTEVVNASSSAGAERGHKSPAQVAGYLCTLPSFHKFLQEKFPNEWGNNFVREPWIIGSCETVAKQCIYDICAVTSRRDLTDKNTEWHELQLAYRLWQNHPELEDA